MSQESVQFTELVRLAAARLNENNPDKKAHYCEQCGTQKPHSITTQGQTEIYTCLTCGFQTTYDVL